MRTAWFVLMVSLLAGCASGPPRLEPNQTLERYLAYSGEPIDRFSSSRLNGWEPLARPIYLLIKIPLKIPRWARASYIEDF